MALFQLAISAADDAFQSAIRNAYANMLTEYIQSSSNDRTEIIARHAAAIALCAQVHTDSTTAIIQTLGGK